MIFITFMKFKLYREYGALNSPQIFDAFEHGIISLGHSIVTEDEDVVVIWSVLWSGRMKGNYQVYQRCVQQKIPVIILEVGNLKRGTTWRVGIGHVNNHAIFGNTCDLDVNRIDKLQLKLAPVLHTRSDSILIAAQHYQSLQWEGNPTMQEWCRRTVLNIQEITDRKIVIRPHPRNLFLLSMKGTTLVPPTKIINSYDDFNISYNFHCVVNYNSGPAIQAAIHGVPIVCDSSSLAYPVSDTLENIDNPILPDRGEWFLRLCHTEWTIEEIAQGIPQSRLLSHLNAK
jgi:hypothetical protein